MWPTLLVGLKSLSLQKMRAGLAALGIFIGTTTVIWLVAIGEGVSYQAQQQIKELGATNIIVRSVKPSDESSDDRDSGILTYGLLREDLDRILSNLPNVHRAIPMRELRRELSVEDQTVDTKLVGCTEAYFALNRLSLARGRWFSGRDRGENVVVLASETAKNLFPVRNPIGQTVRMGSDRYVVIGQTRERAASAAIGGSLDARDYNLDAYIPLSTLRRRIGDMVVTERAGTFSRERLELSQITLTVDHIEQVDASAGVIRSLLEQFHERKDYSVVIPKELLDQAERTRSMFNVLLVVIAGISLLVGGIGIMNIMLATVTERTREIGIRRALGAKRRHIVQQFLAETTVLTAVGGLLGVLCGLMCGPLFRTVRGVITHFQPDYLPEIVQTIEPRIAPWSILLALIISVGAGVLFGVYPARRAAWMDPIEALRHE